MKRLWNVCVVGCCGLVGNGIEDEGRALLNDAIGLRQQVVCLCPFFCWIFIFILNDFF